MLLDPVRRNAASKQDQIGALNPGELADRVLIEGNPLAQNHDRLRPRSRAESSCRGRQRRAAGYTSAALYSVVSLAQARSASALL